jgi:hypothetical protein
LPLKCHRDMLSPPHPFRSWNLCAIRRHLNIGDYACFDGGNPPLCPATISVARTTRRRLTPYEHQFSLVQVLKGFVHGCNGLHSRGINVPPVNLGGPLPLSVQGERLHKNRVSLTVFRILRRAKSSDGPSTARSRESCETSYDCQLNPPFTSMPEVT